MADINQLMKQAQEIQAKLARLQEEAGAKTVEASAGGGMVAVTVNGRMQVVALRIEREVLDGGDVEMLQDLVTAAVNEGLRKAQKMVADEMGKVAGGLKLPGAGW